MNTEEVEQQQSSAETTPEHTKPQTPERSEPMAPASTEQASSENSEKSADEKPSAKAPRQKRERPDRRGARDGGRGRGAGERQPRRTGPVTKPFERFVVVTWSGQREPVDTMFWAEARREGEWVILESLEQIRTRREVLERLVDMPTGIAALEFSFSYPVPFLEHLGQELGDDRWRALLKKVREDLKKNAEDGIRAWIDRIGTYREAHLDPDAPVFGRRDDRRGPQGRFDRGRDREVSPQEQRSKAERFRRTDLTIRHAAERHVVSPVQIAFNRLTGRYEFNDPSAHGRATLLGMSMLEQLLEARPDAAVWPFMMPKPLTVVELQPWIYTRGATLDAEEIRRRLQVLEDAGWEIPSNVRDIAARNPDAQRALVTLIGIIRTESRDDRANRPLRDYSESFYGDAQVRHEGWYYGVGYRSADEPKKDSRPNDAARNERGSKQTRKPRTENGKQRREGQGAATATSDNPIVNEPTAEETELMTDAGSGDTAATAEATAQV
jgi:hypothetical protein